MLKPKPKEQTKRVFGNRNRNRNLKPEISFLITETEKTPKTENPFRFRHDRNWIKSRNFAEIDYSTEMYPKLDILPNFGRISLKFRPKFTKIGNPIQILPNMMLYGIRNLKIEQKKRLGHMIQSVKPLLGKYFKFFFNAPNNTFSNGNNIFCIIYWKSCENKISKTKTVTCEAFS